MASLTVEVQGIGGDESFLSSSSAGGMSVADISRLRSGSYAKSRKGELLKSADAAWYVFDNLSCDQAEDLLRQHGEDRTYLVAHFHDPESYGLSIRLDERGDTVVYKHYAIGISGREFHPEGIPGEFPSIEEVVAAVSNRLEITLVPIFHKFNRDTSDFEITMSEVDEKPPEYDQASKFPEAAKKPLPFIVPVYPTLRRMMKRDNDQYSYDPAAEGAGPIDATGVSIPAAEQHHGCCWKAFHTDVNGKWYKPHKAGPITGFLLLIGWIIFLVLFGWIVGLAMLLVLLLILCACCANYICTGRCEVSEGEGEEGEGEGEPSQGRDGERPLPSSNYQQHH